MSALSKIRHNMALIVILIALALLAFLLTDLFTGLSGVLNAPPDAGSVNGQPITYNELDERITLTVNNQQGQGAPSDELTRGRIADQVWDAMVSEIVWDNEMEKSGIEITGEELYDMFAGREISPIVRNYILPPGQPYDQNAMRRQLEQLSEDPNYSSQLMQLEDYAARTRGIERYLSIIGSGYLGSLTAARQDNIDNNRQVSLSYLAVDYNQIPDSTVSVSDNEIRNYLNKHKEEYKQEAETVIRFAKFDLLPSRADTAKAYRNINKRKEAFGLAQNDTVYTSNKARIPYAQNYREIGSLPADARDAIKAAAVKEVVGPILIGSYYKMYKLVGTETAESASAKINHILITPTGRTKADSTAARSKAAGLVTQARSGDFATLASENSQDFATGGSGGSLGWYNKNSFGEDFDAAVAKASVGSIIGPIKSNRGYHIVQILDKTNKTYDVAEIEEEISYSTPTRDSVYRAANKFAALVNQHKDINKAASEFGTNALESNPLTEESRNIIGINGGREVILWGINSDKNDISNVTRVENKYIIAQVISKTSEGVKSVDAVRAEVEREVRNEKKAELIKAKLAGLSGDLNSMKGAYGDGARISTAEGVTFSSSSIPGIGPEKYIIGKAVSMNAGDVSAPIAGDNGVYIIQVTNATEVADLDEAALAANRDAQVNIQKQSIQSKVEPALLKTSEIEDNRAKAEAVLRYGIR